MRAKSYFILSVLLSGALCNGLTVQAQQRERSKGISVRSHDAVPPATSIHVGRNAEKNGYTPEQLIKKVLLSDPKAEQAITNVFFEGPGWNGTAWQTKAPANPTDRSLLYFENGAAFGIEHGLLLATGEGWNAEGPNSNTGGLGTQAPNDLDGDTHLQTIASGVIRGGSILRFDFKPFAPKVSFDFIFASEEFPEYANSGFNDAFGFFIWEKGDSTQFRDIALFPDGVTPVTINNANWGNTSNNTPTGLPAPLADAVHPEWHVPNYQNSDIVEYDGYTIKLSAVADNLDPTKTYTLKLAICNIGDNGLGSAVFLSNLDLGVPEAGINSDYVGKYWDASYDLLGLDHWYADCVQTLDLEFQADNVHDRTVDITPIGLAANYLVQADGSPLPSEIILLKGESNILITFTTKTVPANLEGGTGAIVASIVNGGSDTTSFFKFYNRPTYSVDYILPATNYEGKLDLNLKGGSPEMFRSINGGLSWENAWLPFAPWQIDHFVNGGVILLKEPNSCFDVVIPLTNSEYPTTLHRLVIVPEIADVDIYPPAGVYFVGSGGDFTFTVKPTGVMSGKAPVVKTNRTDLPDSIGVELTKVTDNGDYVYAIRGIHQPFTVSVSFPDVTGSNTISGDEVWSDHGELYVKTAQAGEVKVYNIAGVLVRAFIAEGLDSIALPAGIYIVTLNGSTYKVAVH